MDSKIEFGQVVEGGKVAINIYTPRLLHDALATLPEEDRRKIDQTASALTYAQMVVRILKRRHPTTTFDVEVHPEDKPIEINVWFHVASETLFKEIVAIMDDHELNRRDKWLIRKGSIEQIMTRETFNAQTKGEEDVTYAGNPWAEVHPRPEGRSVAGNGGIHRGDGGHDPA